MKRFIAAALSLVLLAGSLAACGNGDRSTGTGSGGYQNGDPAANNTSNVRGTSIPEELSGIPEEYFSPADDQGTLVDLNYDTYESFSYEERSQPMEKHAVVYLPSSYDESR